MRARAEDPVMRRITVRDVMNPDVITVRDDMTVQEVAAFLVENQISGAPVEDGEGRLVGVVSYMDIARAASELTRLEAPPAEPDVREPRPRLAEFFARGWDDPLEMETLPASADGASLTVGEIMTPQIYSLPADASVGTAARMMLDAHIHRVLVTERHKVVGIVTTSDFLSLLTEVS
jgi:CBS domain-containing protein